MKKVILLAPLVLSLFACNDKAPTTDPVKKDEAATSQQVETKNVSVAEQSEWTVDERLSEPTEDTPCYLCNMKVHMRDEEMGVFAAQAVRADGAVVFYDDIGCLLNDEYVNNVENEKFVRDFHTLNWFHVEEATIVKTDLKSPMNWGYIFFKYAEDAQAYVEEHPTAAITPLAQVREEGIERHKQKEAHGGADQHGHGQSNMHMGEDATDEEHHE